MNNSEFKNLVNKFLDGTATEQEQATLFDFYERSQTNQDWDEELMGNKEVVKNRLFSNIQRRIHNKQRYFAFSLWKAAASIAVIIGFTALFLYHLQQKTNAERATYHTISASSRLVKLTLQDGTQIWLNSGSRLRYPEKFGATREVFLEGEAYFDVAHQSKPFIIRSGKMTTQVLGTSFNVRAFAADKISTVSVLSGKVGITVPGEKSKKVVFLTRNQELAFNKRNNAVDKVNIDASHATAWMLNKIKFRNTPLAKAMEELERVYQVHITYASALQTCPVYADFDRTDNVYKVLNMLAKSLNGKVVKKDAKNYYLSGRPCK